MGQFKSFGVLAFLTGIAAIAGVVLLAQHIEGPGTAKDPMADGQPKVSGPYTHENLTVFLVHGDDQFQGRNFLTLAEALEQKKFVINETQQVNELTMENLSATEEVVIFAGDLLKGGQQDRIAQVDMIVPPKSGAKPLAAFCVEHTAPRWMRSLDGADKTFAASTANVSGKSLGLANRYYQDQSRVWKEVANTQAQLAKKLNAEVKDAKSDSSLALSLQAKAVQESKAKYLEKLTPIVKGRGDVIGYAYAVNGKMVAADIYGSSMLFQKVWSRLLDANVIEALTELEKDKQFNPATVTDARAFMDKSSEGKQSTREVTAGLRQLTTEGQGVVRFETKHAPMPALGGSAGGGKGGVLRTNVYAH